MINPDVLFLAAVDTRLGRDARARRYRTIRAYHEMDWDVRLDPEPHYQLDGDLSRWKRILNYEVLVPERVPVEYIVDVLEMD